MQWVPEACGTAIPQLSVMCLCFVKCLCTILRPSGCKCRGGVLSALEHCRRRYVMFYEAVAEDGARSIGAAVSRDGLRGWQRLLAPVLAAGEPGAWDAGSVGAPCAVPMAGAR